MNRDVAWFLGFLPGVSLGSCLGALVALRLVRIHSAAIEQVTR